MTDFWTTLFLWPIRGWRILNLHTVWKAYSTCKLRHSLAEMVKSAKHSVTQTCVTQSKIPQHFRVSLQTIHFIIPILNIVFPLTGQNALRIFTLKGQETGDTKLRLAIANQGKIVCPVTWGLLSVDISEEDNLSMGLLLIGVEVRSSMLFCLCTKTTLGFDPSIAFEIQGIQQIGSKTTVLNSFSHRFISKV